MNASPGATGCSELTRVETGGGDHKSGWGSNHLLSECERCEGG